MDASLKSLHKNVMEWLAGPAGSIALHAALILALIFLVTFATKEKQDPGVEVTVVDPEDMELDEEELEEFEPQEIEDIVEQVEIPEVDVDMPPPDTDFMPDAPMMSEMVELSLATDISSPIVMEGLKSGEYANRSGKGRASAMGAAGQWGQAAEAAVSRALIWLKNNQSPAGSWGVDRKEDGSGWKKANNKEVGLTGLGVLAFMAHGETTSSQEYGETVTRAIQFLVAKQNEKGEFCKIDENGGETAYSHAIATYAISEAYGMMKIPDLKPVMTKAVDVLIQGQQGAGGYDYGFKKSTREDVSLEAWCCQAMQAAKIAGAKNPGLDEAIEKAIAAIKRAYRADDGSFSYTHDSGRQNSKHTHNTTAMAVLAMQLTGHGNDKEARDGVSFLNDAKCKWSAPEPWPMYGWYYITQVKFHAAKDVWPRWNNQFAPEFIKAQWIEDKNNTLLYGSWESPGVTAKVQGDFDSGYENYNRAYATSLAALSLQVYYRHLQTYQPIEERQATQKSDDDVSIAIF